MKQIIPIMFCFDKNYVIPAAVATYSLLENNRNKAEELNIEFKMYVVHTNISSEDQEKLKSNIQSFSHFSSLDFIDGGEIFDETWEKIRSKNHFSKEMFFKLITPSLFPQYEKIIISDVDAVFLGDIIEEFMAFDIREKYLLGGVFHSNPEAFLNPRGFMKKYKNFNSDEIEALQSSCDAGYMIINIKKWRDEKIEQLCLSFLYQNSYRLVLPEQDVISIVCKKRIKKISLQYCVEPNFWLEYGDNWEKMKPNIYSREEIYYAQKNPIQIHYHGDDKPWRSPSRHLSNIWFQYLVKTVFLNDFLLDFEKMILQKNHRKTWRYKLKRLLSNPYLLYDRILNLLR